MNAYEIKHNLTLSTIECSVCAVIFAIPLKMKSRLQESSETFYCPNGHRQYYPAGKNELERLREKLDEQTKQATAMAEKAHIAAVAEKRARNELVKIKKRASVGVCPCCNRTFQPLARHMKSKHPDLIKLPQGE